MFKKGLKKVLAIAVSLAMLGTALPINQASADAASEAAIYENGFEADEYAVTIGDTKALEFNAIADATNSWLSIFQQEFGCSYEDELYSGAILSFDILLPEGSTYTGSFRPQAVTKMGPSWTWTQSATIPDIKINNFEDSGKGYLVEQVSIPFGAEIEEEQGIKSILACLAASNCNYEGNIYLDNVKLTNGVAEPVVGETVYQNDFEGAAEAVVFGGSNALEFDAVGDVTNSWVSIFQPQLPYSYQDKLYSGATLSYDLILPEGSTYTGNLRPMAVTQMGSGWEWIQSSTIPEIGIEKFKDFGNGYLVANISIPFGTEIEDVQGLQAVVPCLAASNCDYVGKIYLDNVKLINGISTEPEEEVEVEAIIIDFPSQEDISSWSNGGEYQYSGGLTFDYEELKIGDGTLKLGVDYSGNSNVSWSEAKAMYTFASATQLEGYNRFYFDFIYDPAAMTKGSFMAKLFAGTIDKNAAISMSAAENYGNGLKKVKVAIKFTSASNTVSNFTLGIVGANTDYKGNIYIDNITICQEKEVDIYVNATLNPENQTPVAVSSDAITANGTTQPTSSTIKLVDDNAINATAQLYAYLEAIGKTDSVLFGHQNDLHHKAGSASLSNSDTKDVTGSYSAVVGFDTLSLTGNELATAKWNDTLVKRVAEVEAVTKNAAGEGAVITLSAHMPNFEVIHERVQNNVAGSTDSTKLGILSDGHYNFSGYTPNTCTGNVVTRIMPGQDLNYLYTDYLDMIAAYAKALEDDNITVLFRPFHENTGSWFWWGAAFCDKEAYQNLYRYTVEYLRDKKDVHNFIYVYGPSSDAQSVADYSLRYPGDDYVDMVGFDMYHQAPAVGDNFIEQFKKQLSIVDKFATDHNKLFAVTETGVASTPDSGDNQTALHKTGNQRKDWFNEILAAVSPSNAAYFLVWANFSTTDGFYTPYVTSKTATTMKGHEMLDNFIDFYNDPRTIFANGTGDFTKISTTIAENNDVAGYIISPVSGSRVLKPLTLEASIKNAASDDFIKFVAKNKTGSIVKEISVIRNTAGIYQGQLTDSILAKLCETAGTISLVVNDVIINTVNAKFNMPEPVIDPTVVDSFEYYYGDNDVLSSSWSIGKGTGCTITPALTDSNKYEGNYGLAFNYSLVSDSGYAGVARNMDGADWSSKNAVQLWTKPDGKKQKVVVQVTSAGNVFEVYLNEYEQYLGSTEPVLITIPFSSFVGRDDKSAVFDPTSIDSFGLWCNTILPEGENADTYKLDSVIYYDGIKAVSSEVANVTFKALTSTLKLGDVNDDGAVDSIDFALLKMHLLNGTVEINTRNADLNQDGTIDSIDFARLKMFLLK